MHSLCYWKGAPCGLFFCLYRWSGPSSDYIWGLCPFSSSSCVHLILLLLPFIQGDLNVTVSPPPPPHPHLLFLLLVLHFGFGLGQIQPDANLPVAGGESGYQWEACESDQKKGMSQYTPFFRSDFQLVTRFPTSDRTVLYTPYFWSDSMAKKSSFYPHYPFHCSGFFFFYCEYCWSLVAFCSGNG